MRKAVKIKVEDNSRKVKALLHDNLESEIRAIANKTLDDARGRINDVTGTLSASGEVRVFSKDDVVGAYIHFGGGYAFYGPFVELGIPQMGRQPYLRPAVRRHASEFYKSVKDALSKAAG
jgi:hypothetical protein